MEDCVGTCEICGGILYCIDEVTDHIYCDTCEFETQYGLIIEESSYED